MGSPVNLHSTLQSDVLLHQWMRDTARDWLVSGQDGSLTFHRHGGSVKAEIRLFSKGPCYVK